MIETEQKRMYEQVYSKRNSDYGIADRKIEDGRVLSGKRILCVGCGSGPDIWYLAEKNQVFGMDYATSGLEVAAQHGIRGVQADLNSSPSIPFRADEFDVVVLKDILEHLVEPLPVLRDAARVLRPGGYIIVSVPNHFAFAMRLRLFLGRGIIYHSWMGGHEDQNEWSYMHIRFFTFSGFKKLMAQAGLKADKWFWDFGNLAHYHQPEMYFEPQLRKRDLGLPLSKRAKFAVSVLRPLWKVFNVLFPKALRSAIVSLAPGLLCGGFYVRCVKQD